MGDPAGAGSLLAESAALFRAIGNPLYLPWCLEGLAAVEGGAVRLAVGKDELARG